MSCHFISRHILIPRVPVEENLLNMYNYLMDRLRDNLHVCLCFSPVNAKFPIRAQKFPAVFTVNINWFMPWPEAALVAVSSAFLGSYKRLGAAMWIRLNNMYNIYKIYIIELYIYIYRQHI